MERYPQIATRLFISTTAEDLERGIVGIRGDVGTQVRLSTFDRRYRLSTIDFRLRPFFLRYLPIALRLLEDTDVANDHGFVERLSMS